MKADFTSATCFQQSTARLAVKTSNYFLAFPNLNDPAPRSVIDDHSGDRYLVIDGMKAKAID
jgi:hypothetical protein